MSSAMAWVLCVGIICATMVVCLIIEKLRPNREIVQKGDNNLAEIHYLDKHPDE